MIYILPHAILLTFISARYQTQLYIFKINIMMLFGSIQTLSSGPPSLKLTLFIIISFRHNTRHVALKIVYLGWDYQGFAAQEDTDKTIEDALFKALHRTRLIESR